LRHETASEPSASTFAVERDRRLRPLILVIVTVGFAMGQFMSASSSNADITTQARHRESVAMERPDTVRHD
jgi:hypothetical protein